MMLLWTSSHSNRDHDDQFISPGQVWSRRTLGGVGAPRVCKRSSNFRVEASKARTVVCLCDRQLYLHSPDRLRGVWDAPAISDISRQDDPQVLASSLCSLFSAVLVQVRADCSHQESSASKTCSTSTDSFANSVERIHVRSTFDRRLGERKSSRSP